MADHESSMLGWEHGWYVVKIGMLVCGFSAASQGLLKKFDFTGERVLEAARGQLAKAREIFA